MRNESGPVGGGMSRETAPVPEVLAITDNKVQAELALLLYKRSHSAAEINLFDPMQTPKPVRDAAMAAWIEGGFATAFSEFRDSHADMQIRAGDESELARLLSAAEETLH